MIEARHSANNDDCIKKERNREKGNTAREILSWMICLVSAFVIAMLLRTYVFEFVKVDGASMNPTLTTEQRLFVEKISKLSDDGLKIDDIVIVHYPNKGDTAYVKRIVGLAGDTIAVKDGKLIRNGKTVDENFTRDELMISDFEEITVPEGSYFVMGDNRNDSLDSRMVGSIKKSEIVGHALCVIWPVWEFKTIEN